MSILLELLQTLEHSLDFEIVMHLEGFVLLGEIFFFPVSAEQVATVDAVRFFELVFKQLLTSQFRTLPPEFTL